jgi:K+-transporting ATPase A subunit
VPVLIVVRYDGARLDADSWFGRMHKAMASPVRQTGLVIKDYLMVYTIIGILVLLWLLGLIGHIGGGLIHLLLVVALVVFIYRMISGRRHV